MPHYWGFSNVLWYVYHTSPDTEFKSLAGWLKAQLSQWSQFSCVDGDPLLLTHAGHSFYCSRTHTHARMYCSLQTKHVTHSCTTMPLTPGSELKLWHRVGFVGEISRSFVRGTGSGVIRHLVVNTFTNYLLHATPSYSKNVPFWTKWMFFKSCLCTVEHCEVILSALLVFIHISASRAGLLVTT